MYCLVYRDHLKIPQFVGFQLVSVLVLYQPNMDCTFFLLIVNAIQYLNQIRQHFVVYLSLEFYFNFNFNFDFFYSNRIKLTEITLILRFFYFSFGRKLHNFTK